jgi:hypothetical protein
MFLQQALQLITLLSLAISILYLFLPYFSELISWIAVAVLVTVPVILIARQHRRSVICINKLC